MAARGRKKNKESSALSLMNALNFISKAQHKKGQMHQTHCFLSEGMAIAFDGTLTIGHKIEEEISACPHTETLITALSKCDQIMHLTQLDSGKLSIKSDKFRTLINCDTSEQLPTMSSKPDAPIAPIDDRFKTGLETIAGLVGDERNQFVTDNSVLVNGGCVVATNRAAMIEYWHGCDLPPNMALPKLAVTAIVSAGKPLVKFGYSGSSATFWFEDESYIKTQLIIEPWPDIQRILNVVSNPWPLPPHFFEAIDTLLPFTKPEKTERGVVYFKKGVMQTHANAEEEGATFLVDGLPEGPVFDGKLLKLIQHCVRRIDFSTMQNDSRSAAYFFGDNLRGAICGIKE